jgi:hypothetical protein
MRSLRNVDLFATLSRNAAAGRVRSAVPRGYIRDMFPDALLSYRFAFADVVRQNAVPWRQNASIPDFSATTSVRTGEVVSDRTEFKVAPLIEVN